MWGNTMRYPMLLGLGLIPLSAKRRLFHGPTFNNGHALFVSVRGVLFSVSNDPMKGDTKRNGVNKASVFIYCPALNLARILRGSLL